MSKRIDLTGRSFGRLKVIEPAEGKPRKNGYCRARWVCLCECGNRKIVYGENLTSGATLSCGCLQKERAAANRTTHGDTNSRLYNVWSAMKRRCYNINVPEYGRYGARGISVCDEWRNDYAAFKNWAISSGYDEAAMRGECTLDRIDNNGDYCPDNCRWATQQRQMNNVSYNQRYEMNGENHTLSEWARISGISYSKLYQRVKHYGYTIESAISAN